MVAGGRWIEVSPRGRVGSTLFADEHACVPFRHRTTEDGASVMFGPTGTSGSGSKDGSEAFKKNGECRASLLLRRDVC